jgi:hypothetical protein
MRWLGVLPAFVATIACAATTRVDLSEYFGPLAAPRALRADLIRDYGAGGCIRTTVQIPGELFDEFHVYFDQSTGRWIEVAVECKGGDEGEVSAVLLTRASLCENAPVLAMPFHAKRLLGIKLGDSERKVLASLGQPDTRESGNLGSLGDVSVYRYYPDQESVFGAVYYMRDQRVAGMAAVYSE